MDSVGVFQQRPSQGWGPARKLENPVYATTKFFRALKDVRGYQAMPVYQAAQAVQHSADGAAYIQYERMATEMAGAFTGQRGHAVYCWSSAAGPRHPAAALITEGLTSTFGHATAELAASGAAPHHAGPDRAPEARLGGGVLAGDPRQQVRHPPGPLRRVPVARLRRHSRAGSVTRAHQPAGTIQLS